MREEFIIELIKYYIDIINDNYLTILDRQEKKDDFNEENFEYIKNKVFNTFNSNKFFVNNIFLFDNMTVLDEDSDDIIPFGVLYQGLGGIGYIINLLNTLKTKKNNRPIFLNFSKINPQFLKGLQSAIGYYLSNKGTYQQRIKKLSSYIMQLVTLGKGDRLKQSEDIIKRYFNMNKNSFYKITIKNFYKSIRKRILLNYLYMLDYKVDGDFFIGDEIYKELLKETDIRKKILKEIGKDLLDLNIYVSSTGNFSRIRKKINRLLEKYNIKDVEIEEVDFKKSYMNEYYYYLANYIFPKEIITQYFLDKKETFTTFFKDIVEKIENNKIEDVFSTIKYYNLEKFYFIDFLRELLFYKKLFLKKYLKFVDDRNYVLGVKGAYYFSFVKNQDISNSIQLVEDVYQSLSKGGHFFFDDNMIKEYTYLGKDNMRKKEKKHNLKNIISFQLVNENLDNVKL